MKRMLWSGIVVLLTAFPREAAAQYWGERVLEKGFEQTDFFFKPSYLNPYGIGSFKSATPGLIADPLIDLIINPARLGLDSGRTQYFYTDFRSAREIVDHQGSFYPPWIYYDTRVASDLMYYPQVYLNTRRELEPVFSGAYVGKPLPVAAENLFVGLTYQLVMQDDKYYSVPQDIYRTAAGYDYSGMRAAAAETIPIIDKYSGQDNFHTAGHYLNAFARTELPFGLEIGGKVSRVIFSRDGSFGSSNLWQNYGNNTSLWANLENREQGYTHWDLAGGARYAISDQISVGATVGYLWGDATQSLGRSDSSYYSYDSDTWTSYYNRSGNTGQEWRHDGQTTYYTVDLSDRVSPNATLSFIFQHAGSSIDLGLNSAIGDTSDSWYRWTDSGGGTGSSTSFSSLRDVRAGGGTTTASDNRLLASLQWKIDEKVHLSVGAQYQWQSSETQTVESVQYVSNSEYASSNGDWNYMFGQAESKDLRWTFTSERTSLQIPIFLTITASEVVQVLLGLNRNMTQYRIDDVTLALFRYRISNQNGTIQQQTNFGERYTQPTEKVSDIRTSFLAGLTISPSRVLGLRLLMVPVFRDSFDGSELEQLQWWIGLTLTP